MVVGDSSLAGDREVCSSHLSSPPWPPRGWWVPGPPAAWGASMQYVHFRPLVGRQKLLMCSLLLSLMDLLLSFALVLFPATKQRESLTLGCCMGLLWLGDNAKRDGVQMGSAGAFCCRSLPEWCVEHAWMILHRELITEWFSDRWYPLFFLKLPSSGSFRPQECNWQRSPLIFIASCCLAPRATFWPGSRLSHYSASPLVPCSVYWCRLGSGVLHRLGPPIPFWCTVRPR